MYSIKCLSFYFQEIESIELWGHSLSRGAATWGSKVHVYLSDSDIKLLWDGFSDCFSLYVNSAVGQRLNAISTFSFTSLDYTTFGLGTFTLLACLSDLGHVCTRYWGGGVVCLGVPRWNKCSHTILLYLMFEFAVLASGFCNPSFAQYLANECML